MKNVFPSISFMKLWRKEMKHNIGLLIVASMALFFGLFAPLLDEMKEYSTRFGESFFHTSKELMSEKILCLTYYFGEQMYFLMAITMSILAIAIGIFLMGDFYSRKRRDFYFSLPVKREKWFWIVYMEGIFCVAAPYLLFLVIELVILSMSGMGSVTLWAIGIQSYLVCMLFYINVFSIVVLIANISGTKIYAAISVLVLFLLGPIWGIIVSFAADIQTNVESNLENIFINMCPPIFLDSLAISAIEKTRGELAILSFDGARILVMLMVVILSTIGACLAFVRRGEEERILPIVFPKVSWLVKGVLFTTMLFFFAYATINTYIMNDYSVSQGIPWVVGTCIMSLVLGSYLLDRYFDREKGHYVATIKQQGILAVACIALLIVTYFSIGFSEDGTIILFPVHYNYEKAVKEGCPIVEGVDFVAHKEKWDSFLENVGGDKDRKLRIAYTNGEMRKGAAAYFEICYKDGKYQVFYSNRGVRKSDPYKHMKDFKHEFTDGYLHYVILTNQEDFTMEEIKYQRNNIELIYCYIE